MSDPTVTIDFVASPDSVARLESTITNAIASGFAKAFNKGGAKGMSGMWREAEDDIRKAANAFKDAGKWAGKLTDASVNSAEFVDHLATALRKAGWEGKELDRVMQGTNQRNRGLLIDSRVQTDRSSLERQRLIERETKMISQQMRTQGELQVNSAKVAGKQRVAITQFTLNSLLRLERGFGRAIKGVASTATSALSRMFDTVGSLARRHNRDFNSGLDPALGRREGMLRSSFGQQEGILRRSAARQRATLDAMNRRTSTGLLGAATGRGVGGGIGLGALIGGAGLAASLKVGYDASVNLVEQMNKTRVVFGASSQAVVDFAATSVSALATTRDKTLESAATFGNLFRAVGLAEGQSADMSITLVKLATDLASFNNTSVEDAFTAIRSGLVGEQEPLRRFGVNLNEATLKAKALELGLHSGKGVLSSSAKAQAAYALILEQTTLAQGDFARTAEEGANAQRRVGAAFKDFMASIMEKVIPLTTAGFRGLFVVLQGFAAMIRGEVSPALQLLRTGLIGAAAGMGAIIAAKAAVEVVGLLGKTVMLMTSPMGLLLLTAAGLGAAMAVLLKRSEALREAFGKIGAAVRGVVARLGDALKPTLDRIGRAVTEQVVPAVDRFADMLGRTLLPALEAVGGFIVDTLIPGVVELALGAFRFVAPVFQAVGDALAKVRPLLQPAIDGFKALGSAVGGVFSGGGGLGAGLGAAASGIAATAVGIAAAVGRALAPVGRRILDFLGDVFSGANLRRLAFGFLDFVEEVGRIIGTIVTHPTFVKALAAIAGAAVVIGARFAWGLIQGILSNLPGLFKMVSDLLGKLFKSGFKVLGIAAAAVLAAAMFGPKLFAMFRKGGTDAGTSFLGGFKTRAQSGLQFLSGVAGGAGTGLQRQLAGVRKEYAQINVQRRALGAPGVGLGFMANDITSVKQAEKALRGANKELGVLKSRFTESEIAGRLWRFHAIEGFKAVRGVASGALQVVGGVASAAVSAAKGAVAGVSAMFRQVGRAGGTGFLSAFRGQMAGSWTAIKGGFTSMKDAFTTWASNTGRTTGQAFGVALKSSMKAAAVGGAAAFLGFQAGKMEGEAGGSGATSAITAGLTGFALSGGNPIVGGVAAGASLIGTAWGKAKKAAEDFRQAVRNVADTVKGAYRDAMEDGQISTVEWAQLLAGRGEGSLRDALLESLGPDTIKMFNEAGIGIDELMQAVRDGEDGWGRLSVKVLKSADDFDDTGRRMALLVKVLEGNKKAIEELANLETFAPTGATGGPFSNLSDMLTVGLDAAKEKLRETKRAREELDTRLRTPLPVPGMDDFERGFNEAIVALGSSTAATLRAELAAIPVGTLEWQVKFAELELEKARISDTISASISEGIADGAITSESELKAAFDELKVFAVAALGPDGAAMADSLMDGLIGRFREKVPSVANAFTGAFIRTSNGMLGIRSPSKVFAKIGGYVVEGFANGIDGSIRLASRAADRMRNAVTAAASVGGGGGYAGGSVDGRQSSIVNNVYLPTGDPAAAALAVTNRQMSLLWP